MRGLQRCHHKMVGSEPSSLLAWRYIRNWFMYVYDFCKINEKMLFFKVWQRVKWVGIKSVFIKWLPLNQLPYRLWGISATDLCLSIIWVKRTKENYYFYKLSKSRKELNERVSKCFHKMAAFELTSLLAWGISSTTWCMSMIFSKLIKNVIYTN
jgi:hypothetical protein